jgi:peptidoglycan/LPS O-acetylase OafA/YrhL
LRYLGDISYTLYLQHMAVIYALRQLYAATGLDDLWATWLNGPVTFAASVAVAALTSRFLERDMLRLFLAVCRAAWRDPAPRVDGAAESGTESIAPHHARLSYPPVAP